MSETIVYELLRDEIVELKRRVAELEDRYPAEPEWLTKKLAKIRNACLEDKENADV